jgi:hypothetical protein
MFVHSVRLASWMLAVGSFTLMAQADDLHFKKNISVAGNSVSSSETWVKGARERTVSSSPAGTIVTLRQCDLKRTVTLNEQSQSYLVANDPQDDSAAQAAALLTGVPTPTANSGGTITQTATVTDTGERKQVAGYTTRHLKTIVVVESSPNACSHLSQKYDIDGWYADIAKEQLGCSQSLLPVRQVETCSDRVIVHRKGTGKPGYPLHETITLQNEDATATTIEVATSEISKPVLKTDLFEVPAGYREVKSVTELYVSTATQQPVSANSFAPVAQSNTPMNALPFPPGAAAGLSGQAAMLAQSMGSQLRNGTPDMQGSAVGAPVPLPQGLGPKAPGKIRIGIAPAQAQLGQGNNSQADYGTSIRNAIVFVMNGPAVEIAALDARLPMQVQAEAQQKQCDYILFSSITVKHGGGGFGKFMKAGSMAASLTPMGAMAHGMSGMIATQAAMQTVAMTAQQQAMNQLAGFNGQIKSKDDVTVEYQIFPTGQTQAKLENSLKGKAKSDGEDVLTPLIQQAANSILAEVTKK